MQVDDVDRYGASHIVMTKENDEHRINFTFNREEEEEEKGLLSTSVNGDSLLYMTSPWWIKFSIIKDDYKEKKAFDIFII